MSLGAAFLAGWIGLMRYRANHGRKPVNERRGHLRRDRPVQCSRCSAEYRWDGGR